MFETFPSLTRFSQGWTITEKIDGSNGQIFVSPDPIEGATALLARDGEWGQYLYAGSRSRFLEPTKQGDHMGFASWVQHNAEALVETLGYGRHYGEWWGQGIQRRYGLTEKRFSLFNVDRWRELDNNEVPGLYVAPVIGLLDQYYDCPGQAALNAMAQLKAAGSYAAPGFMDPEGIVMYHSRSRTLFKKTFDYDEEGKWAENHKKGEHNGRTV